MCCRVKNHSPQPVLEGEEWITAVGLMFREYDVIFVVTIAHMTICKLWLCARHPTYCFRLNIACFVRECAVGVPLIRDHANLKKGTTSIQLFPSRKLFTGTFLVRTL